MDIRRLGEQFVGLVVVLVVGSLLLGQLLGQPVLLGYVETGSMAPTMQPGDGFIAVPMSIAGPVETGDVIVFQAETLHGGGLTTHRVVDTTSDGLITKGDANPVTDQSSGEPPVQRDQIVAKALQVGGSVVVIPNLGVLVLGVNDALSAIQRQLSILLGTRALLGTQGLAYLLFMFGVVVYLASVVFGSSRYVKRKRSTRHTRAMLDGRLIIVGLTVLLLAVITASMVVPSGPQQFTFVSSQSDAPGPRVIPTGESENLTYVVPSNGLLPVVVYLEPAGEDITVSPQRLYVPGNQRRNATVTLRAPPETGTYDRTLVEHRYVAVLPRWTIDRLYGIHPWLPLLVIDLLVGLCFVAIATSVIGWGVIRVDSGAENVSIRTRIRRWLR